MRELTIKRHKSFVGSLCPMQVYVEDAQGGELVISGVNCRKLGTLKNGKSETFEIPDTAVKIFVIADKLSKDYCNDCYALEAGAEPVSLSGKCKLNPAAGNAFCFDGNDTPRVQAERKKKSKVGLVVLIVAGLLGGIGGYVGTTWVLNQPGAPETFTVEDMQITLTDKFQPVEAENLPYNACYGTSKVGVYILREGFELVDWLKDEDAMTYGKTCATLAGLAEEDVKNVEGVIYTTYTHTTEDGTTYFYFLAFYKADDAFWQVTFATEERYVQEYYDTFFTWAKSVTFA